MEVREAIEKLKQIRGWYENGVISMDMANKMGRQYVDVANEFYKQKGNEMKVGSSKIEGVKIAYNVKYWPKKNY